MKLKRLPLAWEKGEKVKINMMTRIEEDKMTMKLRKKHKKRKKEIKEDKRDKKNLEVQVGQLAK